MQFVHNFGGQIETKYTKVLSVLHILILHDSPKVLKILNFMLIYFDTVKMFDILMITVMLLNWTPFSDF